MGKTGYKREYDVELLVGLTELKAQVCWKDTSVRLYIVSHTFIPLTIFTWGLGSGEKVCGNALRVSHP